MILPATTEPKQWTQETDNAKFEKMLQELYLPHANTEAHLYYGHVLGFINELDNEPEIYWCDYWDQPNTDTDDPTDLSEWYMEEDLWWRFSSETDWPDTHYEYDETRRDI